MGHTGLGSVHVDHDPPLFGKPSALGSFILRFVLHELASYCILCIKYILIKAKGPEGHLYCSTKHK